MSTKSVDHLVRRIPRLEKIVADRIADLPLVTAVAVPRG